MATNAQLLDQAMGRLGQRKSLTVRANVVLEINSTIAELERGTFLPWFLESSTDLALAVDDTSKALPTDFLREEEESRPYFTLDGTVRYLTKRFYGTLQGEAPTNLRFYAIRGETFHFRFAADIAYTVTVDYYAKSNDAFVDNAVAVSNKWLLNAETWVLNEALKTVAALHINDAEKAATFALLAQVAKKDLYIYHESRINENQDFEVGGSSGGS